MLKKRSAEYELQVIGSTSVAMQGRLTALTVPTHRRSKHALEAKMALQPHVIKAANEDVVMLLQDLDKEFIETVADNVAASIAEMALDL